VALKKPSNFFNKKTSLDQVHESLIDVAPQEIENLTEAFQVFKTNLNNVQTLSEFSSTINEFKENFKRVELLSQEIEEIKESVSDSLKKKDLDEAMISHLLFVEKSIEDVQKKVKSLNSKILYDIKEEFQELQEIVTDFVDQEIPSYKKQVLDHERRIDNRFLSFKENVNENIEKIDEEVELKISSITETISSINQNHLNQFKEEVLSLEHKVDYLLEDELPKYKKFFADTELKTEEKINNISDIVESKINVLENDYQSQIQDLNSLVKEFIDEEIPKYKSLITESKIKIEKDFDDLENSIQNKIRQIDESVKSLIQNTNSRNELNENRVTNQLLDLNQIVENTKNQIDKISNTYENLHKDFRKREIYENEKLESYQNLLDNFKEKIDILENNFNEDVCTLQENLDISTSKYYDVLKKEVGYFEENILNKVKDLEVNIVVNEKHIKDIQNSVYEVLDNLKLDLIEEKSKELTNKISHVESILNQFNEKTVLNEGLLNEPPNIKNSDPLTPLDQNYVTLKDLQEHYRLFINRIQQQLSTIGGGGAVRLDDLDDVDRSTINTNDLLIFNGTRWVGIASTSISGSTALVDLTDVDTANLGDGRFLRYDASTSEFTFAPVSASNLELIAGDIQSGILTTNSTSPATVMSISATTYRSVIYQIQVTEGTNYNMTSINVLHDGTNTYMTEYGTTNQPIGIATFSTDISGGSLRLIGYPSFASETTFKVVFTAIES
jgi:DNA repair exonuclease SbcCD ATPase subunit